jgi:MoxR-like ATPase
MHLLFSPYTIVPDLFGPDDIQGLREGHRRRLPAGFLPEANTFFGDEIFKAGNAILNALLTIMNEKLWSDDGQMKPAALSSGFFASNEFPEDDSLAALYDRIQQRYEFSAIKERENFTNMLMLSEASKPDPIMDWADVEKAKAEVAKVAYPRSVAEAITDVRYELLEQHNITPSPRRYRQLGGILRAEAWLAGRDKIELEDVELAEHVLWEKPEQRAEIAKVIVSRCNPHHQEVLDLVADWSELAAMVDETQAIKDTTAGEKGRKSTATTELTTKLNEAMLELKTTLAKPLSNRARASALKGKSILVTAYKRALIELHHLPETMIDGEIERLGF